LNTNFAATLHPKPYEHLGDAKTLKLSTEFRLNVAKEIGYMGLQTVEMQLCGRYFRRFSRQQDSNKRLICHVDTAPASVLGWDPI
jgi:hypothetical protein